MSSRNSLTSFIVGRGALRNPWIFSQAAALAAGERPRAVSDGDRARFLLAYIEMLEQERVHEEKGFRHVAPGQPDAIRADNGAARGHDRWVINKLRALNSWFTKGLDNGSHLRVAVNQASSIADLKEIIERFFTTAGEHAAAGR